MYNIFTEKGEQINGNYKILSCNVYATFNGLMLLKRTFKNSLSNFLICWTLVIWEHPASEPMSYVWGTAYILSLGGIRG